MDLSLRLMPFQAKGVDFLADNPRALLAWEPGVGKTPTAVRACVRVKARRVLVFCPVIATSVWRQHFRDWSWFSDVRVLDAQNAVTPYSFIEGHQGPFVCIVPYSRASMGSNVIQAAAKFSDQWDVVILDECHYLKSPDAKRTKAIYGEKFDLRGTPLAEARHIWCLTGTPLLNGPHEYWTHLRALKPELISFPMGTLTYSAFVSHYCVTKATTYGWHVVGTKNSAELAARTKAFAQRLRTKDVLLDLPPLRVTTYPLPPDAVDIGDELRDALEAVSDLEGLDDDELLNAVQAGGVQFSTLRRLIGEAKVGGTAQLVRDTLESGPGKLIAFAHHRDAIDELTARLGAALVIHGGTSQAQRDHCIWAFQNEPHRRLIILGIEAASEAITLTAANNVIVMEPSPVPARNAQAIARAHRKGQHSPVLAQFVMLPGTFDARFMALIARKTRDISQIVDSP